MNTTKVCNGCKEEKLLIEYNKDKDKKDGLQTRCRSCKQAADNAWREQNRDHVNAKSKVWREANPERAKENVKRWHKEHRERSNELNRASWKRASKERKLRKNISVAIKRSLKGGCPSKAIFEKLGYTPEQLKEYISLLFKEGMSWDNHGEWHIDHIVPQSWLPFESIEDENFIKCWSLSNLQPLWAKENLSKQDKYSG